MAFRYPDAQSIPVGIVLRRSPGVTRWAKWTWRATDILPGAGPADWKVLQAVDDVTLFHAATLPLTLYPSDTEAYVHEMQSRVPSVYAILRHRDDPARPLSAVRVTASPYEAQDYCDSGEEIVEKVAIPEGMRAWIDDFIAHHHTEEAFVKRRRDRAPTDGIQQGIGDPRITQTTDVYRAPTAHPQETAPAMASRPVQSSGPAKPRRALSTKAAS